MKKRHTHSYPLTLPVAAARDGSTAGANVDLDPYVQRKVSRVMDASTAKGIANFSPVFGLGATPETVRMHFIQAGIAWDRLDIAGIGSIDA